MVLTEAPRSREYKRGCQQHDSMLREEKRHVAEGLGCSNMKIYELTSLEWLLNTYKSSWVERKERKKATP
jgi:hypothetical protein